MTSHFSWKRCLLWAMLLALLAACEKPPAEPLILPAGAEPSSFMFNERGTEYFNQGNYREAVIAYIQATAADPHAGEIHYNIALCRYMLGQEDKLKESLKLAKQYALGNPAILQSPFYLKYMKGDA
ncbi:tetratricopeptide repeat protein [Nitrospina watsonii]|uniref:TPR domain protein, component of TonB system n=1 Tax=Nitrospina watsonii TaxID=1323948 RepID=A0ABM9HGX6_9BACT|nr:tetratricopeptide repeat protein [Nitrospina watsonii]CAI2719504.1 putative TPR domain protein, component of TonB system [Nitrospina watsonii]